MAQYLMPSGAKSTSPTRALWLIPFAAFLAILPLILKQNSCGHDQIFHVQGWYDAAQQLHQGHYPRWSFTSAWNAGEPRFLFYPPLSWLLGATLTMIFPPTACPTIFIAIVLLTAGLTFFKLASEFASTNASLIASTLYLANPYMLFNAFERTAYAELLAAAWIPLLLLAILRPRPTIRGIAIPVALLWLTNAPAAVMGCYALALLATLRLILSFIARSKSSSDTSSFDLSSRPKRSEVERPLYFASAGDASSALPSPATIGCLESAPSPLRLALTCIAGTLLGLTLPAFYLIPAAYERRFIQVTMAIIPGMRPQDNFLFTHTTDAGHNGVNLQISLLALTLIALTVAALLALFLQRAYVLRKLSTATEPFTNSTQKKNSVILSEVSRSTALRDTQPKDLPPSASPESISHFSTQQLPQILILLAIVIIFLLFPPSTFLWLHVPELAFLQLPWRLLTLLTPTLALTIAMLLTGTNKLSSSAQDRPHRGMRGLATISTLTTALILPTALGFTAFHLYSQFNPPDDTPAAIAARLSTHHGFPPTDEYTPTNADNDILRSDNPGFWLLPANANPNTPAPNTTPTATELNPSIDNDDTPIPLPQTLSTPAPHHFHIHAPTRGYLVLNLRDYPNWDITETDPTSMERYHPAHNQRDDGLIALTLWYGSDYTIDITWHRTPDQTLGLAISALALVVLALTFRKDKLKAKS